MHEQDSREDIDLTPMLDVVFIMPIFFIVTASFVKESGIDVNRPDSDKFDSQESATILVSIPKTDEIRLDRRLIDPRALRATMERLYATTPDGGLVIQADRKSTNNTLARLFHQLPCKIGQAIVRTADFPIEPNTRVYFRLRKICCANNRLARAR